MKKRTKFGLLLAGVAAGVFYGVHKLFGKKAPSKPASPPEHVTAPPTSAPKAPAAPAPAPHAPADPSAPLPGQESLDGNVHFDQPGTPATLPGQESLEGNVHFDQEG